MLAKPIVQIAQIFTVAVLSILLFSCGWDERDERLDPPPEINSSLTALVKADPAPNHYEVHLQWEPSQNGIAWVIQRRAKEPSPKVIATVESTARRYVDSPVTAGETYRYFLGVLNDTEYKVLHELQVQIPRDYVVEDTIVAHSIESYNRLFFGPKGRLLTYGGETVILVNEIISNGGVIETFPETARAPFGVAGRSGGKVTIQAKTGQGTLHIVARGEGGGVGMPGTRGKIGYSGRRGYNGECIAVPRYHPERGSITGYANQCRTQTENGVPGGQGYVGNPGSPGKPGGDSARVYVRIEDPSRIQIKPQAVGGRGGLGGPGGPGGFGGPGGEPGDRLCNECRMAFPGGPGQSGHSGPIGTVGQNGAQQPICLSLGTATFGDCDNLPK